MTRGLRFVDVHRMTGLDYLYLSMPRVWRLPARKRQQRFIIGSQAEGEAPALAQPVMLYTDVREAAQAAVAYSLAYNPKEV